MRGTYGTSYPWRQRALDPSLCELNNSLVSFVGESTKLESVLCSWGGTYFQRGISVENLKNIYGLNYVTLARMLFVFLLLFACGIIFRFEKIHIWLASLTIMWTAQEGAAILWKDYRTV